VKARAAAGELPAAEQGLAQQLARVRALAEARSAIRSRRCSGWPRCRPAGTDRAPGRDGDRPRAGRRSPRGAVLALAQWRTIAAADDSPEAAVAEARMRRCGSVSTPATLETAARRRLRDTAAAAAC
jgi:hypothetical protein